MNDMGETGSLNIVRNVQMSANQQVVVDSIQMFKEQK